MFRKFFKKDISEEKIPDVEKYRQLGVKIGKNFTNIGPVDFSSEPYLIKIGDDVRISMNVHFVTHDGGMHVIRQYKKIPADVFGTIEVKNNVFIGMNVIILPGVKIGNNVKIGANAVVVEDIPDGATCVMQKPRIIIK